jgi:hypothetical protein
VEDVVRVEEGERLGRVAREPEQAARILDRAHLAQGLPGDVLAREEGSFSQVPEVECARDERVLDPGEDEELALDLLRLLARRREALEELQGEVLLQVQVGDEVDRARPAPPQLAEEPVARPEIGRRLDHRPP